MKNRRERMNRAKRNASKLPGRYVTPHTMKDLVRRINKMLEQERQLRIRELIEQLQEKEGITR